MTFEEKEAMNRITEARLKQEDVSEMYDPGQEIHNASVRYVRKLQRCLEGRMIRRTIDSLKPDGTRINDKLPPCIRLVYPITLPEDEMKQLRGEIDDLHDGYVSIILSNDYN